MNGLWAKAIALQTGNCQWVYRVDKNSHQRSEVYNLESTRRYSILLQPEENFCSCIYPRDRVFLDASDIKTTWSSTKLLHQRLGPFTIEQWMGLIAYRLKLPLIMKKLHPVFNMVKLSATPTNSIIRT